MELSEALAQLDPANDEQWTADGLPKVDAVADLVGNAELKRADITAAAPDFNREAATAAKAASESAGGEEPKAEEAPAESYYDRCVAKCIELNQELNEVGKQLDVLNAKRRELEILIHRVSSEADQYRPRDAGQQNITDYLARQKQITREKAEKRQMLVDSGAAELLKGLGKAPIDEAMNKRKPARGSQRPDPRAPQPLG